MAERKSRFLYDDLIACARGDLFGPGNAQLPLPLMLMFDRITHISEDGGEHGKGQIVAELDVKPDLWFFRCHFFGDPVMPGCLGIDALWQMLGFFLGWLGAPGKGRALGVGDVKFTGMVLPGITDIGHAGLPRYRCPVADAGLLSRLARRSRKGACARSRRCEIHRNGAARHHRYRSCRAASVSMPCGRCWASFSAGSALPERGVRSESAM